MPVVLLQSVRPSPPSPVPPRISTRSWRISSWSLRDHSGRLSTAGNSSGGWWDSSRGIKCRRKPRTRQRASTNSKLGEAPRRMLRTVSGLPVASSKRRRSEYAGAVDQFEELLPPGPAQIRSRHAVSPPPRGRRRLPGPRESGILPPPARQLRVFVWTSLSMINCRSTTFGGQSICLSNRNHYPRGGTCCG